MKKGRILKTAAVVIAAAAAYTIRACMPFHGADKPCDLSSGGNKVEINGRDIWYDVVNPDGEGTPIYVLAGGTALSSDYLESSLMFISESRPLIFWDQRCQGRSEYTRDLKDCDFESYSDDLEALRKYLTPDKDIIVMSHSYGGAAALQYAADHGSSVEGMVFISSVGIKTKLMMSDAYFHIGLPPLDHEKADQWFVDHMEDIFKDSIVDETVSSLFSNTKINYALYMKNDGMDRYDFSEKLKGCDIPALILLGGEKEIPITNMKAAETLHECFVRSEICEFPECGHFLFYEAHDAFMEKVDSFFDTLGAA